MSPHTHAGLTAGPTVVCTIIAKNYLAAARVLMESVRQHHDDVVLVTLLVDDVHGYFDPASEPFEVMLASDLGIPRWKHFSLKYDIMELSTAVKPYFLEQLFLRYNARKVIYFDPDIVVYARFDSLFGLLDRNTLVLTPHITDSLTDAFHPSDLEFLRVGTFNLGFVALSRSGEWRKILRWWQEKLYTDCTREVDRGLFVDQHWMDLAPSLFDGVAIERNTGYNIAYWNFKTRALTGGPDGLLVDGHPLVFFHFSGFDFDDPEIVSKHQDRFVMSDLGSPYRACFDDYRERLRLHGYEQTRHDPYAYGTFPDGVPIPDTLRSCLRRHDARGERWPDPYDITAPGDFRRWAVSPWGGKKRLLSPFAYALYYGRPDLREAFPGVAAGDACGYADWFVHTPEHDASPTFRSVYVDPVKAAFNLEATRAPRVPLTRRATRALQYYARFPVSVWPYMPARMRQIPLTLPHGTGTTGWIASRVHRSATRRVLRNPWLLRVALSARAFIRYPAWSAGSGEHARLALDMTPASLNERGSRAVKSAAGANVIGYLASETGVGEAARNVLRCLDEVGFPVSVWTIHTHDQSRKQDSMASRFPVGAYHDVNIFNVNADQTFPVRDLLGADVYQGRYNIGYWFWEMPTFPKRWLPCLDVYDEIWTSSAYTQAAISRSSMKPVVRLPVAIDVALPAATRRADFELPDDCFLVLCVFDALSVPERKNPWAVIDAFACAFGAAERKERARLVVKVTNLDRMPEMDRRLRARMTEVNGILIDRYFDRLRLNALRIHCDVYVSLHRSEGFGLNIAEAMFLGKPVIVTAYSGNMDFTTPDNSYLVPYTLVKLGRDYPPYDADNDWAEPDTGVAAAHLRSIYEDRDTAARVGRTAALDIRRHNSPRAAGEAMVARLTRIEETRR